MRPLHGWIRYVSKQRNFCARGGALNFETYDRNFGHVGEGGRNQSKEGAPHMVQAFLKKFNSRTDPRDLSGSFRNCNTNKIIDSGANLAFIMSLIRLLYLISAKTNTCSDTCSDSKQTICFEAKSRHTCSRNENTWTQTVQL